MFKRYFVLPIVICFAFCGCSYKETVSPIVDNLAFTAKIDYNNEKFVCDATLIYNTLNLTVVEPENIKGFTLQVNKNGAVAKLDDISYNFYKYNDVADTFYKIIIDIKEKKAEKAKDDNCRISGEINGYGYIFIISPSGLPISLKIDELKLNIQFNNVTIKNKSEG